MGYEVRFKACEREWVNYKSDIPASASMKNEAKTIKLKCTCVRGKKGQVRYITEQETAIYSGNSRKNMPPTPKRKYENADGPPKLVTAEGNLSVYRQDRESNASASGLNKRTCACATPRHTRQVKSKHQQKHGDLFVRAK